MKKPYEFLEALRAQKPLNWNRFVQVMSKHGISPKVICYAFSPDSNDAALTSVCIQDLEVYHHLLQQFQPVTAHTRIDAALAGNSHQVPVEGSLIVLQEHEQANSYVALSRDGLNWTPLPGPQQHLVLIENMQNFLCSQETFSFLYKKCGFSDSPSNTLLAYGAGNAATKACHTFFYQKFSSISCLFDMDLGGITIYASIKKLLVSSEVRLSFLIPQDLDLRLKRSRCFLSEQERCTLYQFALDHPELEPAISLMLITQKKLEQEVYLKELT